MEKKLNSATSTLLDNEPRVGFIGAGKVGTAFGRYLVERGVNVVGYSSRTKESATQAAKFTMTNTYGMDELLNKCNYVFITTSDQDISNVWNQIKKANLQDKKIFHMSGSLSSNIFEGIENCQALGYSLHPLFPFTDQFAYQNLDKAIFTIEGKDIVSIELFLSIAGLHWFPIDETNKAKYHAAAVVASNFNVVVAELAKELFIDCGLPPKEADKAIYSLLSGTVMNIGNKGVEAALTGPFIRGDVDTVKRHLLAIDNDDVNKIYRELAKRAVKISVTNGNISKEKAYEFSNLLGGERL